MHRDDDCIDSTRRAKIYIDTAVFIYVVENHPVGANIIRPYDT